MWLIVYIATVSGLRCVKLFCYWWLVVYCLVRAVNSVV